MGYRPVLPDQVQKSYRVTLPVKLTTMILAVAVLMVSAPNVSMARRQALSSAVSGSEESVMATRGGSPGQTPSPDCLISAGPLSDSQSAPMVARPTPDISAAPVKLLPASPTASDIGDLGSDSSPDAHLSETATTQAEDYILGAGDKLRILDTSITGLESPQASEETILPGGEVAIYPIGVVQAAGLSLTELTKQVNERASRSLSEPQIVISVLQPRPVSVYVLGDVENPGLYGPGSQFSAPVNAFSLQATPTSPVPALPTALSAVGSAGPGPTTATQGLTVLTAIQLAGGVRPTADIFNVRISRAKGRQVKVVDLWRMIVEGDRSEDIPLQSGDSVFVPKGGAAFAADAVGYASNRQRPVRVLGRVFRPGVYYLSPGDDLFTLLSRAGGLLPDAKQGWVLLSRYNHDGSLTTRKIHLKPELRELTAMARAPVMPGDVVVAHRSLVRSAAPKFFTLSTIFLYTVGLQLTSALIFGTGQGSQGRGGGNLFGNQGLGNGVGFGALGLGLGAFGGAPTPAPPPPPSPTPLPGTPSNP